MFQIPGPVKTLFETFPLKTYPPVFSEYGDEQFVYFGEKKPSNAESPKFTLGVHGLTQIQGKTLPTDPFSLACCLILCHRHGLSLPRNLEKSPYRMTALSYKASPKNELPLLIEHANDNNTVIKLDEMQKAIADKNFGDSVIELLINLFLDDLGDLWILILLHDLANSQAANFPRVFNSLKAGNENEFLEGLLVTGLLGDIAEWNAFKTKYPLLFHTNMLRAAIKGQKSRDVYHKINSTAVEGLLCEKIWLFDRNLPLIWDYIQQNEKTEALVVLELKLAAFIFVIYEFVPEATHAGRMIRRDEYDELVEKCRQIVLERY